MVCFYDKLHYSYRYLMLLDDENVMIGYGVSYMRRHREIVFRYRVFPEYKGRGYGDLAMKFISWALSNRPIGGIYWWLPDKLIFFNADKQTAAFLKRWGYVYERPKSKYIDRDNMVFSINTPEGKSRRRNITFILDEAIQSSI